MQFLKRIIHCLGFKPLSPFLLQRYDLTSLVNYNNSEATLYMSKCSTL